MSEASKPLFSSVLFVCNHNSIRSPMAKEIARQRFGDRVFITSAGVHVGEPDPFAQAVMQERGIDLSVHRPKTIGEVIDSWFDIIVTLTPTAHHVMLDQHEVESGEIVYWPSGDPTIVTGSRDHRLEAYRDVADRLEEQIEQLLAPSP